MRSGKFRFPNGPTRFYVRVGLFSKAKRYVDTSKPPVNSLVQVAKLVRPELVIEMEAMAVVPAE